MTHEYSYSQICAQVNSALSVQQVIQTIGWHPDKLIRSGDVYLAFCPLHRDEVFRTLVLNPRNNTYVCKHHGCPGHAPADLLDLLARAFNRTLPEVIQQLIDEMGAEHFRLTDHQQAVVRGLVQQVRGGLI
jgi:hypothetical protein